MATATTQGRRPRARKGKKRSSAQWVSFWPLLLAMVATPFALRAASVLVLSGPAALRLLYPSVMLVQAHALTGALAPEQRDMLAQWAMWAQFPLYGLIASLVGRRRGMVTGLVTVALLHSALIGAAFLLTR